MSDIKRNAERAIIAYLRTAFSPATTVTRDVTTDEAGDMQSLGMDSEGIVVGMQVVSADFAQGTIVTSIANPGATAIIHFSEGKLTTGTTVGVQFSITGNPSVHFVPSKGDDEDNDVLARADGSLEPPFCVVECYEAERLLAGEAVYDAKLNISYVTHISESTSAEHSLVVEQITDVLVCLPRGWRDTPGVTLHGHDIGTATSTEDEEQNTFADVIPLTLGITG